MNPANPTPFIPRGRHEIYGDYWSRTPARSRRGRHEVRTPGKEDFTMASFFAAATTSSKDDTPDWAYDEDDYCVCCGNGKWKYHMPECELRDALDTPDYEAGYKAWFWSAEDLDEKEAFELGVKVAVGLESPSTDTNPHHHPSWSIKHCPYPDGHKPGCSWWNGMSWFETGITPEK